MGIMPACTGGAQLCNQRYCTVLANSPTNKGNQETGQRLVSRCHCDVSKEHERALATRRMRGIHQDAVPVKCHELLLGYTGGIGAIVLRSIG